MLRLGTSVDLGSLSVAGAKFWSLMFIVLPYFDSFVWVKLAVVVAVFVPGLPLYEMFMIYTPLFFNNSIKDFLMLSASTSE